MSLERAIHERWSSDAPLSALLPVARVFSGAVLPQQSPPYLVLELVERQSFVRTSSGTRVERATLRFQLWTADLEQGKAVLAAVARRFERTDFELHEGRVLNMQRGRQTETLSSEGAWKMQADYLVLMAEPTQGAEHG